MYRPTTPSVQVRVLGTRPARPETDSLSWPGRAGPGSVTGCSPVPHHPLLLPPFSPATYSTLAANRAGSKRAGRQAPGPA